MYYQVENLGKIKKAKIDLSNDLTIFCGPNNTGKTFLSYALYGLGDFNPRNSEIIPSLYSQLLELENKGIIELNLFDLINANKEIIYKDSNDNLKQKLPILLGVESEQIQESVINLKWYEETLLDDIKQADFILGGTQWGKYSVNFKKQKESEILTITLKKIELKENDNTAYEDFIKSIHENIIQFLLLPLGIDNFFLSAERSGITVFGKELLSNRFNVTSELQSFEENNRKVISDFLKQRTSKYAKAIQDAIQFQQEIPSLIVRKSFTNIESLANDIESKILNGHLSADESGNIFYNSSNLKISIQQAASTIKSMASLVLFLRYKARQGNTLFIDEPELNLHPDNQRLIARIIAQIVNAGIKVFVSTHSDYIIRELNILILLKKFKELPKSKELMERYNYNENELLNPTKIGIYSFEHSNDGKVLVESLPLSANGININSINKAINNQNVISQDIYYSLVENEE